MILHGFSKGDKKLGRCLLAATIAISLGVLGCQNPAPLSSMVQQMLVSKGHGSVGIQFDAGLTLSTADFTTASTSEVGFELADIGSATVTVTSPYVEQPATVTLTRQSIADGWSYLWEDIPAGPVVVDLDVWDNNGKKLFQDSQQVEVLKGQITPVDFTLELFKDCGHTCPNGSSNTGGIKVTVKTVTNCYGRISLSKALVETGETVSLKMTDLQGNISHYVVDFGDGSEPQKVQALPIVHQYSQSGRYTIKLVIHSTSGNFYTTKAYLTVSDKTQTSPAKPQQFVFTSNRDWGASEANEIYMMNEDGTGLERLTNHQSYKHDAKFSPDGSQMVFVDNMPNNYQEIFLLDLKTKVSKRLTYSASYISRGSLDWSPDGQKLVYSSLGDSGDTGGAEIYVMDLEKSTSINITKNRASDFSPAWAPNGSKIAFYSNRDGSNAIYTMNPDGSNVKQLTFQSESIFGIDWSPDGNKIVFSSGAGKVDTFEIFIMDAEGHNRQQLTSNNNWDHSPLWISSNRILFTNKPLSSPESEIVSIELDSKNQKNLTNHPAFDMF